ncbi:MAG: (deoxy)nucleoside triphosphate pyrophosphohydrolase [Phycisphaerae bacterium]
MSKPRFQVAVAIVRQHDRWLVARRHDHVHLGGHWEFPGGKLDAGETPARAALRELREECDVDAEVERELAPLDCEYDDRIVKLHPVLCRWIDGEATALASQECRWVTLGELRRLDMPAINREIIRELEEWA